MAKSVEATAPAPVMREVLPIKSTSVTVDARNFRTKSVVVDMDDMLVPSDLYENPNLWRLVQQSRDKALNALDQVTLVWFDKMIFTRADFADDSEVVLCKAPIINRRERDRTPWRNDSFEVRAINGQWSYFRLRDGVQMTPRLFSSWEAARAACITEQSAVRV